MSKQPRRRPSTRQRTEISPARLVAYDVVRDVEARDAYANLALASRVRKASLTSRDAALATELAAGSLRMRGRLDAILEIAAQRPVGEIDDKTRTVLRLGAYQVLFMRTSMHAAVNESVELQRRVASMGATGFVNGVLRTLTRADVPTWRARVEQASGARDGALAAWWSCPAWIVRALRDALRAEGRETELEDVLRANLEAPNVHVAWLAEESARASAEPAGLPAELPEGVIETGPSPIGAELESGDPARITGPGNSTGGVWRVQDQGSQLAALALVAATTARPSERWIDLCAGPGGKAAVLAAEAQARGATLRANEVSTHRAELVRQALEGVAREVLVSIADGREDEAWGGSAQTFDRILLDAPCTGLGALRRRPEARWRKQPADIPELATLQAELLQVAIDHLAPWGVLAYVTCSPHLAETRVVLDRVLRGRDELIEIDTKSVLRNIARVNSGGPLDLGDAPSLHAQLWPHRHGTDAMFIALLQRAT